MADLVINGVPVPNQEAPKDEVLPDVARKKVEEILDEKKKLQQKFVETENKLKEYESKLQSAEVEKMKASKDWEGVIQNYENKIKDYEAKEQRFREENDYKAKASALKQELLKSGADARSVEALLKVADFNKMKFDPEHNVVLGVDSVCKEVRETIPAAFGQKQNQMNHQAPDVKTDPGTLEAFLKLPLKDRKDPAKVKAFMENHKR